MSGSQVPIVDEQHIERDVMDFHRRPELRQIVHFARFQMEMTNLEGAISMRGNIGQEIEQCPLRRNRWRRQIRPTAESGPAKWPSVRWSDQVETARSGEIVTAQTGPFHDVIRGQPVPRQSLHAMAGCQRRHQERSAIGTRSME